MGLFKNFLQQNGGINLLKNLTVSDTRWLMSYNDIFFIQTILDSRQHWNTVDLYHVKHQTRATTITHKSYAQWSCLVSSSQSQKKKNCFHAWKLTVSDSIKRIASMLLLLPILYALRWKFILSFELICIIISGPTKF